MVRKIPFNALPEAVRRRFAAATQGLSNTPLLSHPTGRIAPYILWTLFAASVGLGMFVGLSEGFGSPWRFSLQTEEYLALAVGAWLLGYAALAILRRKVRDGRTPFRRGRYLFATDVVNATSEVLEIWPLNQVAKVDVVHNHQNGRYVRTDIRFIFPKGQQAFSVFSQAECQRVLGQLQSTQRAIAEAAQNMDVNLIQQLDLFFEARASSVWNDPATAQTVAAHPSGDTTARATPGWLAWASATALVGAVLIVPVGMARDSLSDDAAFERAVAGAQVSDLQQYMRQDGSHRQEVENVHLPAAAFAQAQRMGNVTALRDYIVQYPNSTHVAAARGVIHQRFEQVKAEFFAQANTVKPEMPAFMNALLAWLEAHDSPPVLVRFAPPSSESLAELDAELASQSSQISPIAPHFTAERMESRETAISEVLERGFAAVFPDDVMNMEHGGRTADVPSTVPTVDVQYVVHPSGATYTDRENGREFVGIHVNFTVRMTIPDSPANYSFTVNVEPPEHFTVSYDDMMGGPSDGAVYSTMARLAFEQLGNQVRMTFFAPGSAAFVQAANESAPVTPPPSALGGLGGLGGLEGMGDLEGLEGIDPEAMQRLREALQQAGQGGQL